MADTLVLSNHRGISKLSVGTRASAYVWTSAILEVFVKQTLTSVIDEINAMLVPRNRVRLSLQPLLANSSLTALQTIRGVLMWERRAECYEDIDNLAAARFNNAVLPLDGRTLKPEHFALVWRIFGFQDPCLPKPLCKLALLDLAKNRNELAHGQVRPEIFARSKPTPDVLRTLDLVEDIALHLAETADRYLQGASYIR